MLVRPPVPSRRAFRPPQAAKPSVISSRTGTGTTVRTGAVSQPALRSSTYYYEYSYSYPRLRPERVLVLETKAAIASLTFQVPEPAKARLPGLYEYPHEYCTLPYLTPLGCGPGNPCHPQATHMRWQDSHLTTTTVLVRSPGPGNRVDQRLRAQPTDGRHARFASLGA